jgi:hypothetical protein
MKKVINIATWVIGILLFYNALIEIVKLIADFNYSDLARLIYSVSLGVIIFPPINNIINKNKQAKLIKILFGSLFFASLILSALEPDRYAVLKEINANKTANSEKIKVAIEKYCDMHQKCPSAVGSLLKDNLIALEDLKLEGHSVHDYRFEGTRSCTLTYVLGMYLRGDKRITININCSK